MAPRTEQYSYELCRRHIDEVVTVSDDELRNGMRLLFSEMKLTVEAALRCGDGGPARAVA